MDYKTSAFLAASSEFLSCACVCVQKPSYTLNQNVLRLRDHFNALKESFRPFYNDARASDFKNTLFFAYRVKEYLENYHNRVNGLDQKTREMVWYYSVFPKMLSLQLLFVYLEEYIRNMERQTFYIVYLVSQVINETIIFDSYNEPLENQHVLIGLNGQENFAILGFDNPNPRISFTASLPSSKTETVYNRTISDLKPGINICTIDYRTHEIVKSDYVDEDGVALGFSFEDLDK